MTVQVMKNMRCTGINVFCPLPRSFTWQELYAWIKRSGGFCGFAPDTKDNDDANKRVLIQKYNLCKKYQTATWTAASYADVVDTLLPMD